jgi:hypothetical protein
MRPDITIIPAPDRSVEARKPLTTKQRAELALAQKGLCGCGCGAKLDAREGIIDEHVVALGLLGANDLANRSLWRKLCSDAKTYGKDLPAMAKAKAQAGETGQYARRQKRDEPLIKGRGFGSVSRGLDGRVKLTKKAIRTGAANDQEAGL